MCLYAFCLGALAPSLSFSPSRDLIILIADRWKRMRDIRIEKEVRTTKCKKKLSKVSTYIAGGEYKKGQKEFCNAI